VSGAVGGQPDVLSSVDTMAQQHTTADISQHSADVTAVQHTADVTVQRHTVVDTSRHSADVTAQRHAADVTAERHAAADISHYSADGDGPSLPLMQNIASLSSTLESGHKSPEAHDGLEPSLATATTVDTSALQTPIDPSVIPVRYYVISLMTTLLRLLYTVSVLSH